ncbi:lysophospholipid acyltransferase family protein [Thioalkalicoccus limnaeus]|uniref:Lysophospholipid acyltransferase family protein n=1 Tax=Thioalkalicoccus limnaeus TaxID=120681 RepID=A0ABV4BFK4_9GAMM
MISRDSVGLRIKQGLAAAAIRLLGRLPLSFLHRLGAQLGRLVVWFPNRQRRNALINIGLCRQDLTRAEQVALRNAHLVEFGKTYFEIAYLWRQPADKVLGLVREVRGGELLTRREGRGLIVLSPHIGAWELAGLYLAAQGPTAIFYKPQKYIDDLILAARARGGASMAPTTAKGVRLLVQALERGDYVGLLPDQEPKSDKGAVFAPFFTVPALTMLLVSRLARKTGAPVVFLFAERLAASRGFRLHCLPAPPGIDSPDEQVAARALNLGIEHCIGVCPEQFLWTYKRFRRRPPGHPRLYSGGLEDAQVFARLPGSN